MPFGAAPRPVGRAGGFLAWGFGGGAAFAVAPLADGFAADTLPFAGACLAAVFAGAALADAFAGGVGAFAFAAAAGFPFAGGAVARLRGIFAVATAGSALTPVGSGASPL